MSKFATLRGTSAAGRSHQEIALQAVEAARKPVDIDDFTRSRRKGVVLLASNEGNRASTGNTDAVLTNNEDDSYMATQENSSASTNPQVSLVQRTQWGCGCKVELWRDCSEPMEIAYCPVHGAAPELLAVCETSLEFIIPRLLEACGKWGVTGDKAMEFVDRHEQVVALRAAIAKAKGGAR